MIGWLNEALAFPPNQRAMLAALLIGATNVGKISLTMSPLTTNNLCQGRESRELSGLAGEFRRGDRLGTFHLGSSVVVLLEQSVPIPAQELPATVRYGEKLL